MAFEALNVIREAILCFPFKFFLSIANVFLIVALLLYRFWFFKTKRAINTLISSYASVLFVISVAKIKIAQRIFGISFFRTIYLKTINYDKRRNQKS